MVVKYALSPLFFGLCEASFRRPGQYSFFFFFFLDVTNSSFYSSSSLHRFVIPLEGPRRRHLHHPNGLHLLLLLLNLLLLLLLGDGYDRGGCHRDATADDRDRVDVLDVLVVPRAVHRLGRGEAQLHDERELCAFVIDRTVVALHDGGHGERHTGKLNEPGRGALGLEREHPHLGRVAVLAGERLQQLVVGHTGRCVEEVEDLARWLDAIFAGLGQRQEAVVLGGAVVLEADRVVLQGVRVGRLGQVVLLGKCDLNFAAIVADWNVVQVLDAAFHGDGISHLDHGGALFGLQELYPDNVSVQTEQIEQLIGVGCAAVEAVDHHDGALLLCRLDKVGRSVSGQRRVLHQADVRSGRRGLPVLGRVKLGRGKVGREAVTAAGAEQSWFRSSSD